MGFDGPRWNPPSARTYERFGAACFLPEVSTAPEANDEGATSAELKEMWWCEVPEIGRRPVVVLSRDAAMPRHRRVLIAPCAATIRHLPSEVLLEPGEDPVPLRSAVKLDSVESVSIAILVERLGRVADHRSRQICAALAVAVDCAD